MQNALQKLFKCRMTFLQIERCQWIDTGLYGKVLGCNYPPSFQK